MKRTCTGYVGKIAYGFRTVSLVISREPCFGLGLDLVLHLDSMLIYLDLHNTTLKLSNSLLPSRDECWL